LKRRTLPRRGIETVEKGHFRGHLTQGRFGSATIGAHPAATAPRAGCDRAACASYGG
jgi:hypothetical protein